MDRQNAEPEISIAADAGRHMPSYQSCATSPSPTADELIGPEVLDRETVGPLNSTRTPYPSKKLIHELFQAQVRRAPGSIAAIHEGEYLTYAELNRRANQLAHHLRAQGVQIGEYLPILMPRCLQMLVAQLAVLKCGAIYVPMDTTHPADRQIFMIRDCGARRVFAEIGLFNSLAIESVQCIDCEQANSAIGALPGDDLCWQADPPPPAYVMYTSGSTGVPKGVVIPHRAVNRLAINNGYAEIGETDRIAHYSNPAFDASTFEVWAALLNGASILIVPQSVVLEGRRFAELLIEQRVTVLWMTFDIGRPIGILFASSATDSIKKVVENVVHSVGPYALRR